MAATDGKKLFALQFPAEDLPRLSSEYLKRSTRAGIPNAAADEIALEAGRKMRHDHDYGKETIKKIISWKNSDSRFWNKIEREFECNSPLEVEEAIVAAVAAVESESETAAVAALTKLQGVEVPTASAILAMVYPERFTVIDQLALRALGVDDPNVAFYLLYNAECRALANARQIDLRTMDRALWEWGKEWGEEKRRRRARSAEAG